MAIAAVQGWCIAGGTNMVLNADLIVNYQEDHPSGTAFKSKNFSPTDPTTGQVLASRAPWDAATLAAPADFPGGNRLGVDRTVGGATGLVDFKLTDALTFLAGELEAVEKPGGANRLAVLALGPAGEIVGRATGKASGVAA